MVHSQAEKEPVKVYGEREREEGQEKRRRNSEGKKDHQLCSQMARVSQGLTDMPAKKRSREAASQHTSFLMVVWPQYNLHENTELSISRNFPGK